MALHACGIDFGTSNSTAAVCDAAGARLLALEDGKPTLPSAVFFNLDEERVAVGRAALSQYLEGYEGRLMRAMKSLLGTSLMDAGTEVGGRHLPFRELIGAFLGELKRRAEQTAQHELNTVVLGRPVRFVDEDEAADKRAEDTLGEIARGLGFKELSFQFEPIAAAHTYEQGITREELVLVVDIGGGTSDFSLIRLSPQRRGAADRSADLLGNSGVHVGGTDFDKRLSLAAVMPALGMGARLKNGGPFPSNIFFQLATWHTINQAYTRKSWSELQMLAPSVADGAAYSRLLRVIGQQAGHHLAMEVERTKIALSDDPRTQLPLDDIERGYTLEIPRSLLEQAIAAEVERVCAAARACVAQAGVAGRAIDTLFFTGGASAVPALRAALAQAFPGARAVEGDLYGSVGCGLAVVARQRYG